VDLFHRPVENNEKWEALIAAISERLGRGPDLEVPVPREDPRRVAAVPWKMILPALLLALILTLNIANVAFGVPAAPVISLALGALALAVLIMDLLGRMRARR
jgi:hypothetical protein